MFLSYLPITANAATRTEVNNVARNILANYYEPDNCLDTCIYNIENCYTQQTYENKDQLNAIYNKAEEITAYADDNEEKVKLIHDWICRNINYAEDLSGYNGYPYSDLANPFTVYKNKEAVCYGFSNLTQLMLQHVNVPCVIVRGNSSSHVWNAVYLDDEWVFTDNTWDKNLTTKDKISYKYYLMNDETYDNSYKTEYIENWAGDACYFPVYVTTSYSYHSIILNSKDEDCISKLPFSENMDKFPIPIPKRKGRTFQRWNNDHDIDGYYYKGFGGWYLSGGVKDTKEDITFTAIYNKVNPEYEVPTDLIGYEGEALSSVALPTGFSWVDGSKKLSELGEHIFKANYTPEDLDDYNVVKDIEIKVTVKDLSDGAIEDAKATVKNANGELQIAEEFHKETLTFLEKLRKEYEKEDASIDSIIDTLNEKLEAYQTSYAKANDSVIKAEKAYQDFEHNTGINAAEVKSLIDKANNDIDDLEKKYKDLKQAIESAKNKNLLSIERLWSNKEVDEETSILEKLLGDIKTSLAGIKKLAETQSSEELSNLIDSLSTLKTNVSTALQQTKDDSAEAADIISEITKSHQKLETAIGIMETELNSVDISAMKARLDKTPKKEIAASLITLTPSRCIYNGKAFKPNVAVKGLIKDKDFTVSYSNNVNVGTGRVKVKGKGSYTGTVTKTFVIVAPTPTISKLSIAEKTTCRIRVKTLAGVSKYEVAYKLKTAKKWNYKTISVKNKTLILKGLKHKKRYQIKIRTVCPGNKFSSWTQIKSIKTK